MTIDYYSTIIRLMFIPKYTITDQLLANITKIHSLVRDLNDRRFPSIILIEAEREAREVSSYASTSIEGNPLPLTEVKRLLKSNPATIRDSEKEVINYNRALEYLNQRLVSGSLELLMTTVLDIHTMVMNGLLPSFEIGVLRKKPVIVNDPQTGGVVYLPPDVQDVETLFEELFVYVNEKSTTVDPLIVAGIFHKQSVIIHPFMDGNGRTTRLATKVLLAKMGLNTFNLFSFEQYYNSNVTHYFRTVGEYGDYNELKDHIDFTRWLEYFSEGIIDELLRVEKVLPIYGKHQTHLEPYHTSILEYISQHGFITDREYAARTKRSKAARTLDFRKLITLGLIERKGGGRSTHYVRKS